MSVATESREAILREIQILEKRVVELRSSLPSCLKSFFRFRVKPGKFCWAYALTRDEAEQKVIDRMNESYPDGWQMTSGVVDQLNDPMHAANEASGNLLQCVGEADAQEFATDWAVEQAGKVPDPDRPKHLPKSRLEMDLEDYWKMQKAKANA